MLLDTVLNFRATFRWVASPQCPMLATLNGFNWKVTEPPSSSFNTHSFENEDAECFHGSVAYINQADGLIKKVEMNGAAGGLMT